MSAGIFKIKQKTACVFKLHQGEVLPRGFTGLFEVFRVLGVKEKRLSGQLGNTTGCYISPTTTAADLVEFPSYTRAVHISNYIQRKGRWMTQVYSS